MKNEEVLHAVQEERNIPHIHIIKRRKANRIGQTVRRNCFIKVIEGKMEERIDGTEKRGRKYLLNDLKEGNILETEG